MKSKIKYVSFLLVMILLLSSCGKGGLFAKPSLSLNFSTRAVVKYKSFEITCQMKNTDNGPLEVDVIKPDLLSNLSFSCQGDKCKISYGALSYDADLSQYPQFGFGNILSKSLQATKQSEPPVKNSDGTWTLSVMVDTTKCTIIIDGETWYPVSIDIPDYDLNIVFSEFTLE